MRKEMLFFVFESSGVKEKTPATSRGADKKPAGLYITSGRWDPIPGTQMTLVLIGKGLVLGGSTFKNRGHWGSRYIYILWFVLVHNEKAKVDDFLHDLLYLVIPETTPKTRSFPRDVWYSMRRYWQTRLHEARFPWYYDTSIDYLHNIEYWCILSICIAYIYLFIPRHKEIHSPRFQLTDLWIVSPSPLIPNPLKTWDLQGFDVDRCACPLNGGNRRVCWMNTWLPRWTVWKPMGKKEGNQWLE